MKLIKSRLKIISEKDKSNLSFLKDAPFKEMLMKTNNDEYYLTSMLELDSANILKTDRL